MIVSNIQGGCEVCTPPLYNHILWHICSSISKTKHLLDMVSMFLSDVIVGVAGVRRMTLGVSSNRGRVSLLQPTWGRALLIRIVVL